MRYDEILGATCAVQEDKAKVWYVKMPEFTQFGDTSLVSPELHILDEESDLNEYMLDPTDPVVCVPDQDDPEHWSLLKGSHESKFGGPGSTMNFWQLSAHSERLTLGVKMHSTAAFLPCLTRMDLFGREDNQRFNENTMRGYPLWLPLTTLQVTDVVMRDEDILCAKCGRHVPDNSQVLSDPEEHREAVRKVCALRYLDGYPDTKVENFPACAMPLSSTSPTHVTPEIMRNQPCAREYLEHVALIRKLLDQASLSTNSTLLSLSSNRTWFACFECKRMQNLRDRQPC